MTYLICILDVEWRCCYDVLCLLGEFMIYFKILENAFTSHVIIENADMHVIFSICIYVIGPVTGHRKQP